MPEKATFQSELTHMLDARILSFKVGTEDGFYVPPNEVVNVGFRVESEEGFDFDSKQVRIILNIGIDVFFEEDPEEEERDEDLVLAKKLENYGFCRIGFIFTLENFSYLFKPSETEEGELEADGITMAHLLAMAYSTSRGMLLVKTRGTSLEGSLMPIVDPQKLMEKNISG